MEFVTSQSMNGLGTAGEGTEEDVARFMRAGGRMPGGLPVAAPEMGQLMLRLPRFEISLPEIPTTVPPTPVPVYPSEAFTPSYQAPPEQSVWSAEPVQTGPAYAPSQAFTPAAPVPQSEAQVVAQQAVAAMESFGEKVLKIIQSRPKEALAIGVLGYIAGRLIVALLRGLQD